VRLTLIFGIVHSYAGNAKGITIPVTLVSPYGTYRASAKQAVYGLAKLSLLEFDIAANAILGDLKRRSLRIGSQYPRIAAVVIANAATVITRNRVDFGQIAGLQIEDWTV
jgi:predicted nucleic acid-binding protein